MVETAQTSPLELHVVLQGHYWRECEACVISSPNQMPGASDNSGERVPRVALGLVSERRDDDGQEFGIESGLKMWVGGSV